MADDRLTVTVAEAARLLGVTKGFVYSAIKRGLVPAVKLGRRVLIPRSRLRQLVNDADDPERASVER